MEQIVQSFNLFVDTSRGSDNADSNGDNFTVNLNSANISCKEGQLIRLNLIGFSMYKNFTNVNSNNSRFTLRTNITDTQIDLPHKNHALIRDIAIDFANSLTSQLLADAITATSTATQTAVSEITPASTAGIAGTSNNVISFKIEFQNGSSTPVAHKLTSAKIQMYEKAPVDGQDSDIFDLLGGKRIADNTDISTNSVTTTINTNNIVFTCFYPAQRHTEQYVYLRTNIPSRNLESSSLNAGNVTLQSTDVVGSSILGKFPIDTEVVTYQTSIAREFFLDLPNQYLSNIQLTLTDHHGRRLPQFATNQNSLGNMSFSATIRIDIIQKYKPEDRLFEQPPYPIPSRFENLQITPQGFIR